MPKEISGVVLYDFDEIAEKFGRCTRTVRRYVEAGQLQVSYLGKSPLVTQEDLRAFVYGLRKRVGPDHTRKSQSHRDNVESTASPC